MKLRALSTLVALSLFVSCAYFNSMYNARRAFADAQRALERGQDAQAKTDFLTTIEKAEQSLARSRTGRWADDALMLIGESRFERDEDELAARAFTELAALTRDQKLRTAAQAYLGAIEVRGKHPAEGRVRLDSALASSQDAELTAFAQLWRARARFALGDTTGAWQDLDAAAASRERTGLRARLDALAQAVPSDSARAAVAFARLLADESAGRFADSVARYASLDAERWGAPHARAALAPALQSHWPTAARENIAIVRARLAAVTADTAAAAAELRAIAARADGSTAARARVELARVLLSYSTQSTALADARAVLLPAVSSPDAPMMLHWIKTLQVLVDRSGEQPLSLFVAGEVARDRLGADGLAARFFKAYADLVPRSEWAPKALLAAAALLPAEREQLTQKVATEYRSTTYAQVAFAGSASDAFTDAEQRLARAVAQLVPLAEAEAARRDVSVTRAVSVLDSTRAVARADSVRIFCGARIDSLGVAGIRADSARAACVRSDTTRMRVVLTQDTLVLKGLNPDSVARAARLRVRMDSSRLRRE